MKLRLGALVLAASLATVLLVAPATSAAPPSSTTAVTTPVTGTIANAGGTLSGVLTITGITRQNGQLAAVGTLTATLTNALGQVIGTVTQAVTIPLTPSGSCQILHLELGPLDLNLLGLQVHLDKVVLDITAQSGSGNLLGNLLCAVAHLLDNPGNALGGIVALLNNILGQL